MRSLNIVFVAKGQVEVLEEKVGLLSSNKILCAAKKSLISTGTEIYCLKGIFGSGTNWAEMVKYPFYPGCGMSSVVLDVGKNVREFKVGDRVGFAGGQHKQFFIARPSDLHKIPNNITYEEATWASLALTTQIGVRFANIVLGESIGIIGVGVLGQLVTQYVNILGASKIIVIDKSNKRLDMAKRYGATYSICGDAKLAVKDIKEMTSGKMLDVIFDITGNPEVLTNAVELLRKLGRLVLLGDTPTPAKQFLGPGVVSKAIKIIGVHGFMYPKKYSIFTPWTKETMINLFYEFIINKRMKVKNMITKYYSPVYAKKAYEDIIANRYDDIGIAFDWEKI